MVVAVVVVVVKAVVVAEKVREVVCGVCGNYT